VRDGSTARVFGRGSFEEARCEGAAPVERNAGRGAVQEERLGEIMRTIGRFLSVLVVVLALGASASGDDVGFAVIVNASNPVTSLSRAELSNIFLKQERQWPDGQAILPVDQAEKSPVRAEFSRVVLGRPVAAVKSFWQVLIFSGNAVPPVEKASNADVAIYVSNFRGAVGYVGVIQQLHEGKSVVSLPPGVKVVRLAD